MSITPMQRVKALFDAMRGKASRYVAIRDEAKKSEAEKKKLSVELKEFITKYGTKKPDGGYVLEDPSFDLRIKQPKSTTLDSDKVIPWLESKGLGGRCIVTVKTVDIDSLEPAMQEGLIDRAEFSEFYVVTEGTPSIHVERK